MASRYWVGGSGTWDETSTTNWSSTSGGAGGASVPTSADDVFFDANSASGNYVVTLGGQTVLNCRDMTIDDPSSGTIDFSDQITFGNEEINWYGSFIINATTTNLSYDFLRRKNFKGTGTHSFKFNGDNPFGNRDVYIQGTGTYNLTDAANFGVLNLYHTGGTLNTNGYNLNVYRYSGTLTSTINLSNSTTTHFAGGWTASNTVNAGTSTIKLQGGGSFNSTATYYNVKFDANSGHNTMTLGTNLNCNKFIVGGYQQTALLNLNMAGDVTCNEFASEYWNGLTDGYLRCWLRSNSWTTNRTITATSTTAKNITFTNITLANAASDTTWGDGGGNSNISFSAGINVYYVGNAGNTSIHSNVFSTQSGGAVSTTLFPKPQDTLIIDNNSPASIDADPGYYQFGTIDASARTTAFDFQRGGSEQYVFGNIIANNNLTWSTTSTSRYLNMFGENNATIDANGGKIEGLRIAKYPSSATVTLLSDLDCRKTGQVSLYLNSGIFDANGHDVYLTRFYSNSSGFYYWLLPSSKTCETRMGEGNWYVEGDGSGTSTTTGSPWYDSTSSHTLTPETSTIHFTSSNDAELRTRSGQSLNNVVRSGGGALTIYENITFNELRYINNAAALNISSGKTLTLKYMELLSGCFINGPGSLNWTGNRYFNGNNITVSSCNATSPSGFPAGPLFVGSGGATPNSTGWTQADAPIRYWVGGAGNWGDTAHWSTTSGGPSGASYPFDGTTEVIFDSNSSGGGGNYTVNFGSSYSSPCAFFNLYADDQSATLTLSQSGTVNCNGDYVLATSVNKTGNGNNIFNSARFGNRIQTNNDQMYYCSFNGGGSYYLDSAIYASLQSSACFNIYDVDFYSNGYSIQSSVNIDRQYNRIVDLTNSYIRCFVDWRVINSGSGTITLTGTQIRFGGYATSHFYGGGLHYPYVDNQNNGQFTSNFTGTNTFDTLLLPGTSSNRQGTFNFIDTQTISDNGSLTIRNPSPGRGRCLLTGTMYIGNGVSKQVADVDFRNFTSLNVSMSGLRIGDAGGNTNVIVDTPKTVYFNDWSQTFFAYSTKTTWALTSGGPTDVTNYPLPQDTIIFENPTIDQSYTMEIPFQIIPKLDFTNVTTGTVSIYHDYNYNYRYTQGAILSDNVVYTQKTVGVDNKIYLADWTKVKSFAGNFVYVNMYINDDNYTFDRMDITDATIYGNTSYYHTNASNQALNLEGTTVSSFNGLPAAGNWYMGDNSTDGGNNTGIIFESETTSKSGSPIMAF